jgi:hypothetical protein
MAFAGRLGPGGNYSGGLVLGGGLSYKKKIHLEVRNGLLCWSALRSDPAPPRGRLFLPGRARATQTNPTLHCAAARHFSNQTNIVPMTIKLF